MHFISYTGKRATGVQQRREWLAVTIVPLLPSCCFPANSDWGQRATFSNLFTWYCSHLINTRGERRIDSLDWLSGTVLSCVQTPSTSTATFSTFEISLSPVLFLSLHY
ncbi:hypothetical protein P171DRAFT_47948 [Karstenula rhodostoma CBS 690.94]|uniref:Uncharacterized protein n=1 Tax=Karstenula rhodostoma CBS 690.94 TaxID=1392251 RepID=A0A9P4UA54_9PLEO|nr:hypothetical protein P171DRAFT_47948 [Karstenula rhodostoma CBS 690.94]